MTSFRLRVLQYLLPEQKKRTQELEEKNAQMTDMTDTTNQENHQPQATRRETIIIVAGS